MKAQSLFWKSVSLSLTVSWAGEIWQENLTVSVVRGWIWSSWLLFCVVDLIIRGRHLVEPRQDSTIPVTCLDRCREDFPPRSWKQHNHSKLVLRGQFSQCHEHEPGTGKRKKTGSDGSQRQCWKQADSFWRSVCVLCFQTTGSQPPSPVSLRKRQTNAGTSPAFHTRVEVRDCCCCLFAQGCLALLPLHGL